VCTPSRAAIMSGRYPFRLGIQNSVFSALRNNSLPLDLKILPQHMKELGYATHMVGKWHLGFCRWEMTPTYRGFDSFYGMYNGHAHYFNHTGHFKGYDLVFNEQPLWTIDILESHASVKDDTPLFIFLSYQAVHGPLEVPEHYVTDFCAHVTDPTRRLHCAMTAAMDEGIGNITTTLQQLGYTDNLLIAFTSDNGGPVKLGSSNWPLRGSKITLWEGGTRSVSFLHSKTLLKGSYTWDGLMHAVDWYPTLVRAAGDKKEIPGINGMDLWREIRKNRRSKRTEFVYNIDDVKNTAALRWKGWKIIHNKPGSPDGWYNPPAGVTAPPEPKGKYPEYMLFDLESDPAEMHDLGEVKVDLRKTLAKKLRGYEAEMVPSVQGRKIEAGKPKNWGGAWTPGWC
ncbi:hypothetical protein BaRGS_00032427, partial [Batillaria attramentaria]